MEDAFPPGLAPNQVQEAARNRTDPEFTIVGDVMVECILPHADLPPLNTTRLVDSRNVRIGGPPLNVAWHLGNLGRRVRLTVFVGERDRGMLVRQFPNFDWNAHAIISRSEWTDMLLEFRNAAGGFQALYVREDLGEVLATMRDQIGSPEWLILNGSRHPQMRFAYLELVRDLRRHSPRTRIAFNPSYALVTYASTEFNELLASVDVTILNRREVVQAFDFTGTSTLAELSNRAVGTIIATYDEQGAEIRGRLSSNPLVLQAESGMCGDFLGAGDGFFSAYLHEWTRMEDTLIAGKFATRFAAHVVRSGRIRPKIVLSAPETTGLETIDGKEN